jgi:uncharacterized protein
MVSNTTDNLIFNRVYIMVKASRDFQVFVKPGGSACNLSCDYCYYLSKGALYAESEVVRMPSNVLESYIRQQIEASPTEVIRFSWHGGEPTLLGLEYFRRIIALQHKYQSRGQRILNGIQTNGMLLDEDWCRFLADEHFTVGLSLDGPEDIHDLHRRGKRGRRTYRRVMRAFDLLQIHRVQTDILCVITAQSVRQPERLYRFFKRIGAGYLCLLPLVVQKRQSAMAVSTDSVPAEAYGRFLCTIFDKWKMGDIGQIKVEIFEEAARTAFGLEPAICIFRPICGDVPVIERNGDFYSCDHFVDLEHRLGNIREVHLSELLESSAQRAFGSAKKKTLPYYCQICQVRVMCNGGCPKDRFIISPHDEPGLNYLCAGYKRFFTHCQPFLDSLSSLQHTRSQPQAESVDYKIGRNDPCPCGSGRKYKKCCLDK